MLLPGLHENLERGVDRFSRLFKFRSIVGPLAQPREREAEVVLGQRPVERHPLAGLFLQRRAKGLDRLLQPCRAALPLAEPRKREAEVVLGRAQSSGTRSRVRSCSAARKASTASCSRPCRSPARRASQARRRGCSASSPSRAAPARGSAPAAPRERRRPPPAAVPCRSPARRASQARRRGSGSSPSRAAPARGSTPAAPRDRRRPLLQGRSLPRLSAECFQRVGEDDECRSSSVGIPAGSVAAFVQQTAHAGDKREQPVSDIVPFLGAQLSVVRGDYQAEDLGKVGPENLVKRRFLPACKAAGVRFRWHDLRAYAISAWLQAGVSIKEAQRRAGHADHNVTLGIYAVAMPDEAAGADLAAIEGRLS